MIEDHWGRKIYDITEVSCCIREGFLSCMEHYGFDVECVDWEKHIYKMKQETGQIWKHFLAFQVIKVIDDIVKGNGLVTFHDDFCLEKLDFDIVRKSGKSVAKTATKLMMDVLKTASRLVPSRVIWMGDETSENVWRKAVMKSFSGECTPETGMKKVMKKYSVDETGLTQGAL